MKIDTFLLVCITLVTLFVPAFAAAGELHTAAGQGNIDLVRQLLENGAPLNE